MASQQLTMDEIRAAFNLFDVDGSGGSLSTKELESVMRNLHLAGGSSLMAQMDVNGDGSVDLAEFAHVLMGGALYDLVSPSDHAAQQAPNWPKDAAAAVRVAVIQAEELWAGATLEQRLIELTGHLRKAADRGAELVVLPELYLSGYSDEATIRRLAQPQGSGELLRTAVGVASKLGQHLCIGYPELGEQGQIYNSCALFDNHGGLLLNYRKTHLFGEAERELFAPGDDAQLAVARVRGVATGLLICMDMEYPEPARLLALQGAQLILVPTALKRDSPCRVVTPECVAATRALENHVHLCWSNYADSEFCGRSAIVDPSGVAAVRAAPEGSSCCVGDVCPAAFKDAIYRNPYLTERRTPMYRALVARELASDVARAVAEAVEPFEAKIRRVELERGVERAALKEEAAQLGRTAERLGKQMAMERVDANAALSEARGDAADALRKAAFAMQDRDIDIERTQMTQLKLRASAEAAEKVVRLVEIRAAEEEAGLRLDEQQAFALAVLAAAERAADGRMAEKNKELQAANKAIEDQIAKTEKQSELKLRQISLVRDISRAAAEKEEELSATVARLEKELAAAIEQASEKEAFLKEAFVLKTAELDQQSSEAAALLQQTKATAAAEKEAAEAEASAAIVAARTSAKFNKR